VLPYNLSAQCAKFSRHLGAFVGVLGSVLDRAVIDRPLLGRAVLDRAILERAVLAELVLGRRAHRRQVLKVIDERLDAVAGFAPPSLSAAELARGTYDLVADRCERSPLLPWDGWLPRGGYRCCTCGFCS